MIEADRMKDNLKAYVEQITEKSKGGMYICPLCGSGNGKNKTGAFSITPDGKNWKCFACGDGGDIFNLIGAVEGIRDYTEQLKRLSEIFGITPERSRTEKITAPKSERTENEQRENAKRSVREARDFANFYLQANKAIGQTDYFKKRGLSDEIINRFKLGYDVKNKCVIIPVTRTYYKARATEENAEHRFNIPKGAQTAIFNKKVLGHSEKQIFVAEGEIDALSIIEVGGEAIALGGVGNTNKLIEAVKESKPKKPLILALDNDEAGEKAADKLSEELTALNIPFYRVNPYGGYKDANEALINDRESFTKAVQEAAESEKEKYLRRSNAYYIQSFMDGIGKSADTSYIPTGFEKLDTVLDGGLFEGLYIIGAISSLGKTTLVMQMADQIAQQGKNALIFSLEMARNEIIAKSISRHTVQDILKNGGNIYSAKTTRGITTGERWKSYGDNEKRLISNAVVDYTKYAKNIYISEGIGNIGAEQVRQTVQEHITFTGNTPVAVIDYIQILAPYSERATDKQNIDKSVTELKRISRDFKMPVIGISSFNRSNYKGVVTMEAFKESGAIEYSSDVLIGLQLKGAGENDFDVTEAKRKSPRSVELVVLKNRNGRTGEKIDFEYYPMFNYFREL